MSEVDEEAPRQVTASSDAEIATLVDRLARRHRSGGHVIERAAILAEGRESTAIVQWIEDRDGVPEYAVNPRATSGGLHGTSRAASTTPLRWVLPAGAFESPAG